MSGEKTYSNTSFSSSQYTPASSSTNAGATSSAAVSGAEVGAAVGAAVVGLGFLCGAPVVGVALAVKKLVDLQVEAARAEMEAERARVAEWMSFHQKQQAELSQLHDMELALRAAEERLKLVQLSGPRQAHAVVASQQQGFVVRETEDAIAKDIRDRLEGAREFVLALPDSFRTMEASPYLRIVQQLDRLRNRLASGASIHIEEIATFQTMLSRTLETAVKALAARQSLQERNGERLSVLLEQVLMLRPFANDSAQAAEVGNLRAHVAGLLQAGALREDQIADLERRARSTRETIERRMLRESNRDATIEAVQRNLEAMGYESAAPFAVVPHDQDAAAIMRIPGGEFIRVVIKPDGALACRMLHEAAAAEATMGKEALEQFRAQEKRWCGDLKQLIRNLASEGFDFKLEFAREIPEASIRVVVLETAHDIINKHAAHAKSDNRRRRNSAQGKMHLK
jgi:hypothetical protein